MSVGHSVLTGSLAPSDPLPVICQQYGGLVDYSLWLEIYVSVTRTFVSWPLPGASPLLHRRPIHPHFFLFSTQKGKHNANYRWKLLFLWAFAFMGSQNTRTETLELAKVPKFHSSGVPELQRIRLIFRNYSRFSGSQSSKVLYGFQVLCLSQFFCPFFKLLPFSSLLWAGRKIEMQIL